MALFDIPPVAALDTLLDREQALILTGELTAIAELSAEKERLLTRLPGCVDDPEALARLQRKLERNQDLLAASARGIRAAQARMERIFTERASLRTYGSDGASTEIATRRPGFNKRA